MIKEIAIMHAQSELELAEQALRIGNIGKVRVCARRACSYILSYWCEINKEYQWGKNAVKLLEGVRDEIKIPEHIRNAAHRLTAKVNQNFNTGYDENPIEDAKTIIDYFLNQTDKQ